MSQLSASKEPDPKTEQLAQMLSNCTPSMTRYSPQPTLQLTRIAVTNYHRRRPIRRIKIKRTDGVCGNCSIFSFIDLLPPVRCLMRLEGKIIFF